VDPANEIKQPLAFDHGPEVLAVFCVLAAIEKSLGR
jgi:hypothetical protein